MKVDVQGLIRTERRRDSFNFIIHVIQRGRIRPAKYIHSITMPVLLYEELRDIGVIDMENYYIDEAAFFENKDEDVIISFINLYACEDMHRRIDYYLVVKYSGSYPIKRTGVSKMNFSRKIQPVVLLRTKTKKSKP